MVGRRVRRHHLRVRAHLLAGDQRRVPRSGALLSQAFRDQWAPRIRHAVLGVGVAGAAAFFVLAATLVPRSGTWSDAFDTFTDHLLVGAGPGAPVATTVHDGSFFTDAHNASLNLAGQAGIVGLLGLVAVAAVVCAGAWSARHSPRWPSRPGPAGAPSSAGRSA
jgi:O-antigen ligase